MSITVRNHTANDLPQLSSFISRYRAEIPDAKLISPEFYTYSPALEEGRNVFSAWDNQGNLVGFAPIVPVQATDAEIASEPHHIWTVVVADPGHPDADEVRSALLKHVLERARRLMERFPPTRCVRLACDFMMSQWPDIDFMLDRGFEQYESMYVMERDLNAPLLNPALPQGFAIQRWRMESEAEQDQYLAAFNRCFPGNPKDRAALQFFMQSPMWTEGTAISAFDKDGALAASVLTYWDPEVRIGVTDDVFVMSEWRGRGLAKYLVNAGLAYLREHGLEYAALEVRASNPPAVHVYEATGHTIVNEEWLLGKYIR